MEETLAGPTALLMFISLVIDLLRRMWSAWQSAKKAVKSHRESQHDIISPTCD